MRRLRHIGINMYFISRKLVCVKMALTRKVIRVNVVKSNTKDYYYSWKC